MDSALTSVKEWLDMRVAQKGDGAFVNIHEARGVLDEEYNELMEALHKRDFPEIEHELKDLIAGGLFTLACIHANALDK